MTCPIQEKGQRTKTKQLYSDEKWYVWVSDCHGTKNQFFNALNAINDESKGVDSNAIFPGCRDSVVFVQIKNITLIKKDFLCHQQQNAI